MKSDIGGSVIIFLDATLDFSIFFVCLLEGALADYRSMVFTKIGIANFFQFFFF